MTTPLFCSPDQPNLNFLSPVNFQFFVKKLPRVIFNCQTINIPGLTMESPEQPNPFMNIPHAGDHISYNELVVTFLVDEEMINYLEIDNWLTGLGFPENHEQYKALESKSRISGQGLRSDATILVLNSSKKAIMECVLTEAFPVSLSDIQLDVTQTDVSYVEATATFRYINRKLQKVT